MPSANIRTVERDTGREQLFREAYGLDTRIRYTSYNDEQWNWDMAVLNFTDSLGKTYGLVEYFKAGDDNSTDHVDFEYTNKEGKLVTQTFDRFIDAELAMVALMRKRVEGAD